MLLFGWEGSPLKELVDQGRVRAIPIPTRRATFKEASRVYEELTTIIISPTSLAAANVPTAANQPKISLPERSISKTPVSIQESKEKGTDHLKKRDQKTKQGLKPPVIEEPKEELPPVVESFARVLSFCMQDDRSSLSDALEKNPDLSTFAFGREYFAKDGRFDNIQGPLGLVAVAAAIDAVDRVEWLMDHGVDPAIGFSPYLATKSKSVRNFLRRYWALNPDKYDYVKAGIPSPLSEADIEAQAERERAKRKKEKHKKKEKAQAKIEAAKPPEQRARELRAAAAEARMLGNSCAWCKKSLAELVPFERLAFKYCSIDCVDKHRQKLNST